ncbi:hypothetical protein NSMM_150052 [Nitrosomonas mobilis]|uniref:Uncharacterized protein n=1 Tax=Nitrosomonas mobilis TaxID=51642 RepID=A0A1G5SAT4_9PROT|nr:hypothetical protein NSMM_150052 [Nitrosomonas mobilis]
MKSSIKKTACALVEIAKTLNNSAPPRNIFVFCNIILTPRHYDLDTIFQLLSI